MIDDRALRALLAAWTTTTVAAVILAAALSVAPYWDRGIYVRALDDTLAHEGWDQSEGY